MKLSLEDEEALLSALSHYGFRFVWAALEEIVDRIEKEVMTVPIPADPEKASLVLLSKRMEAQGARALRNALRVQIDAWTNGGTDERS